MIEVYASGLLPFLELARKVSIGVESWNILLFKSPLTNYWQWCSSICVYFIECEYFIEWAKEIHESVHNLAMGISIPWWKWMSFELWRGLREVDILFSD